MQPAQFSLKVIKFYSENGVIINFYVYDLLYLMHKVYQMPKSFYGCLGTYECDRVRLLERPELAILLFSKINRTHIESLEKQVYILENIKLLWYKKH